MGDYTLEDLAGEKDTASSGSSGSGQWVVDMIDKLDDRGYLQPLIFGPEGGRSPEEMQADQTPSEPGGQPEPAGGVGADDVKGLLLQLYDNAEQIPGLSDDPTTSEVLKLIDGNPEVAERLIEEYL